MIPILTPSGFRRRRLGVLVLIMCGVSAIFAFYFFAVCVPLFLTCQRLQICLLLDEMVSRKHAVVSFHDGEYWIKDLGGLNGSSINGAHAPAFMGIRLRDGDILEFGATNFRVVFVKGGDFSGTVFAEGARQSPLTVPSSPTSFRG